MSFGKLPRRRFLQLGAAALAAIVDGSGMDSIAARLRSKNQAKKIPARLPWKKVFAHYMVCCPTVGHEPSVDDLMNEIREAQKRGLDGFALNCGGWAHAADDYYKSRTVKMYEAARQLGTGFHLFVSADFCCGNGPDDAQDMVETFRHHPNQFRWHGKPVLSTFGGEGSSAVYERLMCGDFAGMGSPPFFIPYFYPKTYHELPTQADIDQISRDWPLLDGYFYFGAVGNGAQTSAANHLHAAHWRALSKPFMADLCPYYRSFGRLTETRGFTSMAMEWEGIIADDVPWVEITTWNDFGEKTYISPFGSPSDTDLWNRTSDYGPINYSHVAYLDASAYYIRWFKTGKRPTITEDELFYFYRTEPKAASGKQFADGEVKRGITSIYGADKLLDNVFVTGFLTKPATLHIHTGDSSTQFDLPAGVSHVDTPFQLGAQRFVLQRDGRTIFDKVGEQEIQDQQGITRYNYFAGAA